MTRNLILILLTLYSYKSFSQNKLVSWSQQNIENYSKEMYDQAQKLTPSELLIKNSKDKSWSSVFLTLNASLNNYSKDTTFLRQLASQLTDTTSTTLDGNSRLIIWERITSGEIIFEGKGLVIDNDLFQVAGRANQILQNATRRNFGFVSIHSTIRELEEIKNNWLQLLSNKLIDDYKPSVNINAKIPEVSSVTAVEALITSLQDDARKQQVIKNCLKKVYNLNEMPKEKASPANYCNPDTYTFSYLGMLFGEKTFDESKDARWWKNFWDLNRKNLAWNNDLGIFEVKK